LYAASSKEQLIINRERLALEKDWREREIYINCGYRNGIQED
jgi:hypothetical protein